MSVGSTDELGSRAVDDKFHVRRLHATILNQLGLDPNNLTFFMVVWIRAWLGWREPSPLSRLSPRLFIFEFLFKRIVIYLVIHRVILREYPLPEANYCQ